MPAPVPVMIRGVLYPSQTEAGRQLGVGSRTIFGALERGALDTVGLGRNHATIKPVICDGVHYPSATACAKALGISKSHVLLSLKRGHLNAKGHEGKKIVLAPKEARA